MSHNENCRVCSRTRSHDSGFFLYFSDSYFFSYGDFGELIMKLSRAALRPLLAAHERGALPLVEAAWGVTARKSSHNASNFRGIIAGKMGRNSSNHNNSDTVSLYKAPCIRIRKPAQKPYKRNCCSGRTNYEQIRPLKVQ